MKSIHYIIFIIGVATLTLSGCAEVPIAKTNCWATATSTVTASTMGTIPDASARGLPTAPCR